jgi:hypothetical protein
MIMATNSVPYENKVYLSAFISALIAMLLSGMTGIPDSVNLTLWVNIVFVVSFICTATCRAEESSPGLQSRGLFLNMYPKS